ncbi:eukaryotic translation initiation factor 4E type 2 [Blastocystis sp. ATCC 50177/Nand II]|uniref:Eukaryotic translation initiation factor 4E type 2 n=1 Tax=Blastocystis sp. subtype 1 (strain ATCC 50177 / NandII) TaxID=478820 RepID=A0A196SPL2_BLAHN|nr:eukaryotic translation initiation factor 4E type 2 [Blastocystis sp. ATCC 50177/Nand II]
MDNVEDRRDHPLWNEYRFWRTMEYGSNKEEYEHGLQSLGSCKTVEEFWKLYCSLPVIGTEGTTNYSFFRNGIEPLWEDPANANGGRITVSLGESQLLPYLWETLLLTTIGEQFNVGKEICGVSVTVKKDGTTLCVWTRTAGNMKVTNQIESVLKTVWNAPYNIRFFYKRNHIAPDPASKPDRKPAASEGKPAAPERAAVPERSAAKKKPVANRFAFLFDDDE